jgi:hypothetical protein
VGECREHDIITYLAHSRVTEQHASEQMHTLRKYAGSHPDVDRAITMISADEDNHLAYCHEELLKLGRQGTRTLSGASCAPPPSPRLPSTVTSAIPLPPAPDRGYHMLGARCDHSRRHSPHQACP